MGTCVSPFCYCNRICAARSFIKKRGLFIHSFGDTKSGLHGAGSGKGPPWPCHPWWMMSRWDCVRGRDHVLRYGAGRGWTCAFSHGANQGRREVLSPLPGRGPQQAPRNSRQAPPLKGPAPSQHRCTGEPGFWHTSPWEGLLRTTAVCFWGLPALPPGLFDFTLS